MLLNFTVINSISIIESLGIIIASITAICGINAWRKETRWKRKYELAEEVMSHFYEAFQNIQNIRSPFGYVGEGSSRVRSENETPEQSKIYDTAYIVHERYKVNNRAIERLMVLKFKFITVFDKKNEVLFSELNRIVNELLFAASEIARINLGEYGAIDQELMNDLKKYRRIIYSRPKDSDDIITKQLQKLIIDVEDVCKGIIGKK